MIWLRLAAATMIAVAFVHAIIGERRLIGPLLASNSGVMAVPQARQVMRFAWHMTSMLMILCGVVVAWPGTDQVLIAIIGAAWLGAGLFDAGLTRGRHIGWPFLTAAGAFALVGSAA